MYNLRIVSLLVFLFITINASSQKFTNDNYLILQTHPTEDGKFIAKFLDKKTLKPIEHWEMRSSVSEINDNNYNDLLKKEQIFPDGVCYKFYPKLKLKTESHFQYGKKVGVEKGFYEDRTIKYKASFNKTQDGITEYFYKNGNTWKTESYNHGWLNDEVKEYYNDGSKKSIANYVNGMLAGKYHSFYKNGVTKRKAKFEKNKEISAKCYDENGEGTDNSPFFIQPNYPGGLELLRQEIDNFDFGFNKSNTDTANFRIIINIDTLGNVNIVNYHFKHADSLQFLVQQWGNSLKQFTPAVVDGCTTPSFLNISIAVSGKNTVWLGEPTLHYDFFNLNNEIEKRPTWFWEFPVPTNDKVYLMVDNLPRFPGGEQNLRQYIANYLQYPMEAQQKGIQGKVFVSFIVEKDGSVSNAKIARSVHPLLDNEALRIIKRLPDWKAGTHHDKTVRVSYTVPINFAFR